MALTPSISLQKALCGAFLILFIWLVQQAIIQRKKLGHIPGPAVASITDIWRYLDVSRGAHQETLIRLHRQYGKFVRIGPNTISIADVEAIRLIYGSGDFRKSAFYDAFQQHSRGKVITSLFTERDEKIHQSIRRPVNHIYSMSTLVKFEPVVDKVIQKLLERLKHEFVVDSGTPRRCDIADWLQFYAFDVITELTFSQPLGFLDNGKDMGDYMRKLDNAIDADAPISQLPWLGYLKKKNPLTGLFAQDSSFVVSFVAERIRSRLGGRDKDEIISSDMLGLILEARKSHLEVVTDTMVWSYCMTNIASGSDSVSVPLRSIIYFVLRDDAIYRKLTREICDANLRSPVSWKDSRQLPYLDAVIKEALRLHPPVGLGLERVVPEGGLRIGDTLRLGPGTQVSMCAWVLGRNSDVFGSDVDDFRPERWLQGEHEQSDAYKQRLESMKRATLTFGYGPRTCIGKNISLMEIYKLIPSLFLAFDMKLLSSTWKTRNSWFVRQAGIDVSLKTRPCG